VGTFLLLDRNSPEGKREHRSFIREHGKEEGVREKDENSGGTTSVPATHLERRKNWGFLQSGGKRIRRGRFHLLC